MRLLANSVRVALAAAAALLFSFSASAQITRDGSVSASATSGTFSATATGDLKIVWAFRSGTATAPALPSGWTSIATGTTAAGGTVAAFRIGCNVSANSSATGTGTWTNATAIAGASYTHTAAGTTANCNTTGVGNVATNNAKTSTSASFTGISLANTTGNSWILGALGGSAGSTCTPAGMTSIAATGDALIADTNQHAASWSTTTCTVSSETWMSYVLEIISVSASPGPTETLTNTPGVTAIRNVVANMSETVSESDSCISCKNAQNIFEGHVTTDAATYVRGGNAAISETHSETDSATGTTFKAGNLVETHSESDSASTTRSMHGAPSETLTTSPAVATNEGRQGPITDTVSETDSIGCVTCRAVQMTDGYITLDSLTGVQGALIANPTENLTTTDSPATVRSMHSAITITLSENDLVSGNKQNTFVESLVEPLTTTDSVVAPGNHPELVETLSESDSCSVVHCHPVGMIDGYVTVDALSVLENRAAMTETLTESDSLTGTKAGTNVVTLPETHTTTPSIAYTAQRQVAMAETQTTTDLSTGVKSTASPAMTETLSELDSIVAVQCITFPSEVLTESDAVDAVISHVANMTDQLFAINGLVTTQTARLRLMTETLTTNPGVTAAASHFVSMTETLSGSDSIGAASAHVAAMAENFTGSDSIQASKAGQKSGTMSESLAITESIATSAVHFAVMIDTKTVSDSISNGHAIVAAMQENLVTADVLAWEPGRLITETLTTSSAIAVSAAHNPHMVETLVLSDSILASTGGQAIGNPVEFHSTSDSIGISEQRHIAIFEAVMEVDAVNGTKGAQAIVNMVDGLTELDIVQARPPLRRKRFSLIESP